jgi:hypothetical protein
MDYTSGQPLDISGIQHSKAGEIACGILQERHTSIDGEPGSRRFGGALKTQLELQRENGNPAPVERDSFAESTSRSASSGGRRVW